MMGRREFITLLGGAAWPLAARNSQPSHDADLVVGRQRRGRRGEEAMTTLKGFYRIWGKGAITGPSTFIATAKPAELQSTQGTPSPYFDLPLTDDFPQRALIRRALLMCGNSTLSSAGEIHLWVDPAGKYFHGSTPPGQETSKSIGDLITVVRMGSVPPVYQPELDEVMPDPILFNRAVGDMLGLLFAPAPSFDWISINLEYEVQ